MGDTIRGKLYAVRLLASLQLVLSEPFQKMHFIHI